MVEEVSLLRLYVMRGMYLLNCLLVVGGVWYEFLHRQHPWDAITGAAFSFWAADLSDNDGCDRRRRWAELCNVMRCPWEEYCAFVTRDRVGAPQTHQNSKCFSGVLCAEAPLLDWCGDQTVLCIQTVKVEDRCAEPICFSRC